MAGITITFAANSRAALTFEWPLNESVFGQGFDASEFGTALFGRPVAYLSPASIDNSASGAPTIHQALNLDGLDATQWGVAALAEQSPVHAAEGFNSLEFGAQVRARDPANDAAFHFVASIWPPLTFRWPANDTANYVFPVAIPAEPPPTPTVTGTGQSVLAEGWSALGIGPPTVQGSAWLINLSTYGIVPPAVSPQDGPFVDFAIRTLRPGGIDATQWGDAFMGGGVRWVDHAGRGYGGPTVGTAFVAYAVRELQPLWFAPWAVPSPLVGFHREVSPDGTDFAEIGQAEVLDNTQRAYPPSDAPQTEWGQNRISHYQQSAYPAGLPARHEYGRPTVIPWHQYVLPYTDHPAIWGPYFSTFTVVENGNRTLGVVGWRDSRHGWETVLSLAGLPYFPEGWDSATFGGHLVADRIRAVPPDPWDSQDFGRWLVAYNDARVISPTNTDAAALGTPAVESNRRWLTIIHGIDDVALGESMVAPRVRILLPYRIEPPYLPVPFVHHGQAFVAPAGIPPHEVGAHALYEFRILITPRWTLRDGYGEPRVWNVTPEVRPWGFEHTEWGNSPIRTQWRALVAQGHDSAAPGAPAVEFRTRRVVPNAIFSFALEYSPKTFVRLADPGLPFPQHILLFDNALGLGIPPPNWSETGPRVTSNVLEHKQQSPFTGYGAPTVSANSIQPFGIFLAEPDKYGLPTLNATQWITPEGIPPEFAGHEGTDPGNYPRIDPWTIWACTEYPGPSVLRKGHIVDYFVHGGDGGPSWGRAVVALHPIPCQPQGIQGDWRGYGEPTVSHWRRWLYPEGVKSFRYGVPVLPTGVAVETFGADSVALGAPTVAEAEWPGQPRWVYPWGLSPGWGAPLPGTPGTRVSNWIQPVAPAGIPAGLAGTPDYVGPPIPVDPAGMDAATIGTCAISLRIRYVLGEGLDSLDASGYSMGTMRDRLRVLKQNRVAAGGAASFVAGEPWLSPKVRIVVPLGLDATAPLAPPAVRRQNRANLSGWDSLIMGDIDRWEAGKIKAHGDDLLSCGQPALPRGVRPEAWDGAWGLPAIAHRITGTGSDDSAVPWPVLVASVCGRRAVAANGGESTLFGTGSIQ